ncbi:MAG: hypothetical protein QNJ54_29485 [Prochloraceae cyanobacterium]|nr:hypothetical protein [Prochloraceae cyanobacterium]
MKVKSLQTGYKSTLEEEIAMLNLQANLRTGKGLSILTGLWGFCPHFAAPKKREKDSSGEGGDSVTTTVVIYIL